MCMDARNCQPRLRTTAFFKPNSAESKKTCSGERHLQPPQSIPILQPKKKTPTASSTTYTTKKPKWATLSHRPRKNIGAANEQPRRELPHRLAAVGESQLATKNHWPPFLKCETRGTGTHFECLPGTHCISKIYLNTTVNDGCRPRRPAPRATPWRGWPPAPAAPPPAPPTAPTRPNLQWRGELKRTPRTLPLNKLRMMHTMMTTKLVRPTLLFHSRETLPHKTANAAGTALQRIQENATRKESTRERRNDHQLSMPCAS